MIDCLVFAVRLFLFPTGLGSLPRMLLAPLSAAVSRCCLSPLFFPGQPPQVDCSSRRYWPIREMKCACTWTKCHALKREAMDWAVAVPEFDKVNDAGLEEVPIVWLPKL